MARQEAPSDVLHNFVRAIHDSIIDPLTKNQSKLALQRELRESKRFAEVENKLKEYLNLYVRFKDNFTLIDNVLEALHAIHASRMAQFLERGRQVSVEESETLKSALEPYLTLLEPIDDIRKLQTTLMNQARLKKLTLPYDEITSTLFEVNALAAKMPQILMDGVSNLSEALEKAA